jgi:alpha-beta hydrolase superfamily lysophospholipase
MTAHSTWIDHFPGNFMWSNATLVTKGMAPYGAIALGEMEPVLQRLRERQHEPHAWWDEWCALGAKLERVADEHEAAGRTLTAGNYYLRAGMYYFTGERFITPGDHKREVGRKAIECQTKGILRRHPDAEKVEVPYEGTTLPAFFMRAPGVSGRAPTVVLFDGLDNCKEMSVLFAGLEFAKHGFNTLAIDGPGQGESMRLRGINSRYDYEVAGTAAYNYVAERAEVDPKKVVVMGYSFGGYYAPRIAAFEKRYAGCVAFGAMHWNMEEWVDGIRRAARSDVKSSAQSHFQVPWVFGARDLDHAVEMAKQFNLHDVARHIECAFLVVHGEDDRIVPLDSAQKLYDAVGSKNKTLKIFTAEEGGAEHVQVDNRQVGVDYIADWIQENVAGRLPVPLSPHLGRGLG